MTARVARTVAMMVLWPAASLAAPSPLREIDHAAVTQNVCAIVVVHANAAIAASLRADDALVRALARLRSFGADDGEFAERAILADVLRSGAIIAESTTRGTDEAKRLGALANDPTAVGHGGDVRDFAAALTGVFERDRALAETIAGIPATLEVKAMRDAPAGLAAASDPAPLSPAAYGRPGIRGSEASPATNLVRPKTPPVSAIVRAAASDLETREHEVSKDESRAATLVDRAVTGC